MKQLRDIFSTTSVLSLLIFAVLLVLGYFYVPQESAATHLILTASDPDDTKSLNWKVLSEGASGRLMANTNLDVTYKSDVKRGGSILAPGATVKSGDVLRLRVWGWGFYTDTGGDIDTPYTPLVTTLPVKSYTTWKNNYWGNNGSSHYNPSMGGHFWVTTVLQRPATVPIVTVGFSCVNVSGPNIVPGSVFGNPPSSQAWLAEFDCTVNGSSQVSLNISTGNGAAMQWVAAVAGDWYNHGCNTHNPMYDGSIDITGHHFSEDGHFPDTWPNNITCQWGFDNEMYPLGYTHPNGLDSVTVPGGQMVWYFEASNPPKITNPGIRHTMDVNTTHNHGSGPPASGITASDIDGNLKSYLWDFENPATDCAYGAIGCPVLFSNSGTLSGGGPVSIPGPVFTPTTANSELTVPAFRLRLTVTDSVGEKAVTYVNETVNQIPALVQNVVTTCNGSTPEATIFWSGAPSTNPTDPTVRFSVDENPYDRSDGWWHLKSSNSSEKFPSGSWGAFKGELSSLISWIPTWTNLTGGRTYWTALWNDTWSAPFPFAAPLCTGVNTPPIAEGAISLDGTNFGSSITVNQGESKTIWLSAARDVDGDSQFSRDPDGWTDPQNGVSGGGRCEWNGDLKLVPFTPQSVYEAISPQSAQECDNKVQGIPHTFDEAPGVYNIEVLKITDKTGAESNVAKIRVEVKAVIGACVSECNLIGAKSCRTVISTQECGTGLPFWDMDICLEWGNPQACLVNQVCSSGVCVDQSSLCGNGNVDLGEECDPAPPPTGNLGGQTCVSKGFIAGGVLTCKSDCTFNTLQCRRGWTEF